MPAHPPSDYPKEAPDLRALLSEKARHVIAGMQEDHLLALQQQLRNEHHPIPDIITMEHAAALTGITVEELAHIRELETVPIGNVRAVRWPSLKNCIGQALRAQFSTR
ncbi:hypothetical protein HY632_04635 [Candidatus Uhrbacteria bacterium]|nr:hypothetical protein [Candidatus Uhrbacteria bacterium]